MGIVLINVNGKDLRKEMNGTDTVYVGCKLPHGLICELGMGTEKHCSVKLTGGRTNQLTGVGITRAPREFMEKWLKVNRDLPFVKSGQIYLADSEADALARATSIYAMQTGFEALDGGQIVKDVEVDMEHMRKLGVSLKVAS